jgi:hypothetical protein
MTHSIPEGLKAKALTLGVSVEVKRRSLAAVPPLYRFSNRARVMTRWLSLADAHSWLDLQLARFGSTERRQA